MREESQLLGSEFEEARGRCADPFPSLARDPALHRLLRLWLWEPQIIPLSLSR